MLRVERISGSTHRRVVIDAARRVLSAQAADQGGSLRDLGVDRLLLGKVFGLGNGPQRFEASGDLRLRQGGEVLHLKVASMRNGARLAPRTHVVRAKRALNKREIDLFNALTGSGDGINLVIQLIGEPAGLEGGLRFDATLLPHKLGDRPPVHVGGLGLR